VSAPAAASTDAPVELDDAHPWPGLAPYGENARAFFHGRDAEAAELLRLVRLFPNAVLYGKSGLGKSSLLQAGLFPLLRAEHHLPVYVRLNFAAEGGGPMGQLMDALLAAIREHAADHTPPAPGESVWSYLHRSDLEIWSHGNHLLTPVLVIDQFEEVFSPRGAGLADLGPVMNALGDLIESRVPDDLAADRAALARLDTQAQRYRVLLSFREDYLPAMKEWEKRVPSLLRNFFQLKPMTRAEAISAVREPGAKVLASGVDAAIVDFVAARAGGTGGEDDVEPVLLSLCCYQLNARRPPGAPITNALLAEVGEDILQSFYADCVRGLPPAVARFIEDQLVQGDRYRGSYPVQPALDAGLLTREQLEELTRRRRLLRIDPQGGVDRVELIHDRLVGVVVAARAKRLAAEREEDERREAARAAEITRARSWRYAVLVMAVLLCGLGWSLWLTEQARSVARAASREATALRLSAEAQAMLAGVTPGGAPRALLQLVAAHRIAPANQAIGAQLLTTLKDKAGLIRMLDGTEGTTGIAMHPDGRRFAAAGAGGDLRIWDAESGRELLRIRAAHGNVVHAVVFSPDGRLLLSSGGQNEPARLWDTASGRRVGELMPAVAGSPVSLAFSPDGTRVATGDGDGEIRLWDAARLRQLGPVYEAGELQTITALAFSPDGARLLAGTDDGAIDVLDAAAMRRTGRLAAHDELVTEIVFHPDGRQFASAAEDGSVRLWSWGAGGATAGTLINHAAAVNSIAYSPDGRTLMAAGGERMARLWLPQSGRRQGEIVVAHAGPVQSARFALGGTRFVSAAQDGIHLWRVQPQPLFGQPVFMHNRAVLAVRFGADASLLSLAEDGSSSLWPRVGGPDAPQERKPRENTRGGAWTAGTISPDGTRLALGGPRGTVQQFHAAGNDVAGPALALGERTAALAYSADGALLAAAGDNGTVRVWRAADGAVVGEVNMPPGLAALAFVPDAAQLAVGGTDPAGVRLAATGGAGARVLGMDAQPVSAIALSADGARLAVGGPDGTVRLWSVRTGQPLAGPLRAHADNVSALAFSADGSRLASGGNDRVVRLWDVASGRELGTPLKGHAGAITALAFHPEGGPLASSSRDRTVRIWPVFDRWPGLICEKLSHTMTREDWRQWVSPDIAYLDPCPQLPAAAPAVRH
jgi:WD40 repeat protein